VFDIFGSRRVVYDPFSAEGRFGPAFMPGSRVECSVFSVQFSVFDIFGSPLMMLSAFVGGFRGLENLFMFYGAIELAFAGFLLTFYRREKYPTIATFFELTHMFGFVIFPLYIPTILLGSIRCRRFLRTLPGALDETIAD
jgi:hypothetical protein